MELVKINGPAGLADIKNYVIYLGNSITLIHKKKIHKNGTNSSTK